MIRPLAFLLISISVGCAAEAQRTNDVIHLRATVQDVVLLSKFSATVTPVDLDPRFALTPLDFSGLPAFSARFLNPGLLT